MGTASTVELQKSCDAVPINFISKINYESQFTFFNFDMLFWNDWRTTSVNSMLLLE